MALYPKFEGNPVDARNKARDIMVQRAMQELNLPRTEIVVRPVRPNDILSASGGSWGTTVVGTSFTSYTNTTLADNTYVSLYGFTMKPPGFAFTSAALFAGSVDQTAALNQIVQMQIQRKGSVARFYTIEQIPWWPANTAWFDDPVTVDQNTNLTISFLATTAGSTLDTRLHSFHGDVVEKKGVTINP